VEEELGDKCDLLHDWLEEEKNDGAPLESSPNSICGATFIFCKVGSMEHYVQSTSSKLQAMCGNWNLLGLTMPSLSEL